VPSEISDLVSYFASQDKGIKFGVYFFDVLCKLKLFGLMSDTHKLTSYGTGITITTEKGWA